LGERRLPFAVSQRRGLALLATACGPRVVIVTGTTLGLKATPGDGNTRPPQVTLGYKRAEAAIVPTNGMAATRDGSDAFSTMAAFDFRTRWFGQTELSSFVGTGFAVREIQGEGNGMEFEEQFFAASSVKAVPEPLQNRRKALAQQLRGMNDSQSRQVLTRLGQPLKPGHVAREDVQDAIMAADGEESVKALEDAFAAVGH
jgi:hypothetical protein